MGREGRAGGVTAADDDVTQDDEEDPEDEVCMRPLPLTVVPLVTIATCLCLEFRTTEAKKKWTTSYRTRPKRNLTAR